MRKRREKRRYFTQETEDAIVKYNSTFDLVEKNRVYEESIHYAFFKLTQNIIHTFKFYHTEVEDLEHLQHEIEIFLLSKIHLYHHSQNIQDRLKKIITKEFNEKYDEDFIEFTDNSPKITQAQINEFIYKLDVSDECMEKLLTLTPPKAYSYFGTIVKRWLIIYNDKNYNKKVASSPIDELIHDEKHSYTLGGGFQKDKLANFTDLYVDYVSNNLYKIFPKGNDAQIADAILEIFRKRSNIDVFNKKALYIYIHEMIDVKTPKITKIVTILHKIFKENYVFYLENDYMNFEETTT